MIDHNFSAAIMKSSLDAHAQRIAAAADHRIRLECPIGFRAAIDGEQITHHEAYHGGVEIVLRNRVIDIMGNIPGQVAFQLREWARELMDMAEAVSRVPAMDNPGAPFAYISTDLETGEQIAVDPILGLAQMSAAAHHDQTEHPVKIHAEPIGGHIEQVQKLRELVAIRRAP